MKKLHSLKSISKVIPDDLLTTICNSKTPLKIKYGCDPTHADLHIGHLAVLRVLKVLQDLGHEIIFIIGDFTAIVGDPTGKSSTRPCISLDEIRSNYKLYAEQIHKILDQKKTRIIFNSSWLKQLELDAILALLSKFTTQQLLERDDFQKRIKNGDGIRVHELIYPVLQGYDSVIINADVEIGGNDQLFNLAFGRVVQKHLGSKIIQGVITCNLLEGIDGRKKMSKSYDNYISLNEEPLTIVHKIMRISDQLMGKYYLNLFDREITDISGPQAKQCKLDLARDLIKLLYDDVTADRTLTKYNLQKQGLNLDTQNIQITGDSIDLLSLISLINNESKKHNKQLLSKGAVTINKDKVYNAKYQVHKDTTLKIKIGNKINTIIHITK